MPKFELDKDKKYKIKTIQDSTVYGKEVDRPLLGLYYLITWKKYPKEENTWKLFLAVINLWKIVSTFYKDHSKKPTATSALLNSTSPIAKPTNHFLAKQK